METEIRAGSVGPDKVEALRRSGKCMVVRISTDKITLQVQVPDAGIDRAAYLAHGRGQPRAGVVVAELAFLDDAATLHDDIEAAIKSL